MELTVEIGGDAYRVALDRPLSLAIPLRFDGPQPNFFGVPPATAEPLREGDFIGDTRAGGGCNVAEIRLVPHCNGTHTETVGHILDSDDPVHAALGQSLMPATVISVMPEPDGDDTLIARDALARAIKVIATEALTALVIRTLPNDSAKTSMVYRADSPPPFFAADAMAYLSDCGVRHLLVDIPSVDRMHDGGRLANHRIFWNVPPGAREAVAESRLDRTITEMIFVDDAIADGLYLLNLQAPAFATHAAPSRPVLYPLSGVAP